MPGGEYAWQKGGIYMTINIEYETDKPLDVDYKRLQMISYLQRWTMRSALMRLR